MLLLRSLWPSIREEVAILYIYMRTRSLLRPNELD